MTTAKLLNALERECPNGVSFDPMAVRLLRQKVPFEDGQIEDLKAGMFQLGSGLWFSRGMILDVAAESDFLGQAAEWLREHSCFSVERLLERFCGVLHHIATPEDCAVFLRHLGFKVLAAREKGGYLCVEVNRKEKLAELEVELATALSKILLGEKIPLDVLDVETGKIIIPANRKITMTMLSMLAKAHDHIQIENSLVQQRIEEIVSGFRPQFAELAEQGSGAGEFHELVERLETAGGTLALNEIEEAMPHLTVEALEGIRAQFLLDVHLAEIGGVSCWRSTAAIHLPEDFAEKLTTAVDTLVALEEKVSVANLEFAMNLFYRVRFREEYALPENDTFMRVCAKYYKGGNDVFPNMKKARVSANALLVSGKRVRSPNTRFRNLGVPIGAELVFTKDSRSTCIVLDDTNQVEYDGKVWAISALVSYLLNVSGVNGFCHFSYEGETLWDRRLRLEREGKQDEYQAEEMPNAEKSKAECEIIGLEGKSLSPATWRAFKSAGTNSRVAEWVKRVESGKSVEEVARESGYSASTVKVQIGDRHRYFKVCKINNIVPEVGANV